MSGPYGLTSTSFRVNRSIVNCLDEGVTSQSDQAIIILAILKSLYAQMQTRGYDVTIPKMQKNGRIASFGCNLPLLKLDIFLTAGEPSAGWVDCKLTPLGWRRTWRSPPYEKIWQEWEDLRIVIDEHLSKALEIEPLRWLRPNSHS